MNKIFYQLQIHGRSQYYGDQLENIGYSIFLCEKIFILTKKLVIFFQILLFCYILNQFSLEKEYYQMHDVNVMHAIQIPKFTV